MSNVPIYGFGGGSGAGGTLTVTAPAGATVTVSKDGKTLTRVAGDDGIVVFRGLASGTWTLSITDGTQTASKTVEIVSDYATSITFFAATIHITYPAGSVCTATDGTTTQTAPDTSGTWDCVVPNNGDWVVSLDSGLSETVAVTTDGEVYTLNSWPLYKNGDTYDSVTGGWKTAGWAQPSTGEGGKAPSVTYNAESVKLSLENTGSSTHLGGIFEPKNLIDLTGIKTLRFKVCNISYSSSDAYTYMQVGVFNRTSSTFSSVAVSKVPLSTKDSYIDVNVISLSGNKYIGVYLKASPNSNITVTLSEILLAC